MGSLNSGKTTKVVGLKGKRRRSTAPKGMSRADDLIAFWANRQYHRSLTYDDPKHGKRRVTFATTRNFDDEGADSMPTVLMCGPMVCSRLMVFDMDHMVVEKKVRMIFVDR